MVYDLDPLLKSLVVVAFFLLVGVIGFVILESEGFFIGACLIGVGTSLIMLKGRVYSKIRFGHFVRIPVWVSYGAGIMIIVAGIALAFIGLKYGS